MDGETPANTAMERLSLCLPDYETHGVLQKGDAAFIGALSQLYSLAESVALERLVNLKATLRETSADHYWNVLTEGMSELLGAEMTFVMKRIIVDDQDAPVEMPPYGEPGSCIMATNFYYRMSDGSKNTLKDMKCFAYGCPCAYMRHDKVFVIPKDLNTFITNNPNRLPTPAEAYIAVPLFSQGKCFAHFGAMWGAASAAQITLSWGFIELLFHSLEDLVLNQFLQGSAFLRTTAIPERQRTVIPHDAISVAQSLRPYAGSLSHELRTPMQGVVGMLDVMYATVSEAVDTQPDPKLRSVFQELKANIEVVQDSSRRAVEAADNVVHAYDMDMSVPDAPAHITFDDGDAPSPLPSRGFERRPEIVVSGSNLPMPRPNKRKREDICSCSRQSSNASTNKTPKLEESVSTEDHALRRRQVADNEEQEQPSGHTEKVSTQPPTADAVQYAENSLYTSNRVIAPGLRHTNMRELIQHVINEGLKLGGRPDSVLAQETQHGEMIEVRSRGSDGMTKQKSIEWNIDSGVPHTIFIDERDLSKLVSCVFLNAIKFTDQHGGQISIYVRLSSRGRCISVTVKDNGPGIPDAFLPKLFKPFSRENVSTTRQSEGLGLGLLVAKGIARKLGGDLICTRAETEGPSHGSEFEIKVPLIAGDTISRPPTPSGSPHPRKAPIHPDIPPTSPLTQSATLISAAQLLGNLDGPTSNEVTYDGNRDLNNLPTSPLSPRTLGRPVSSSIYLPSLDVTSSPPSPTLLNGKPAAPKVLARPRVRKSVSNPEIDRDLASKYPLTFLVAEDNKINRKLLVSMLGKFGYKHIHEAHDGAEAVRQMQIPRRRGEGIDVVLMDLWMPLMDGYEATERILGSSSPSSDDTAGGNGLDGGINGDKKPTVLAVTADVTDGAQAKAANVGMKGFMTKPYKIHDLQRLITEYCVRNKADMAADATQSEQAATLVL